MRNSISLRVMAFLIIPFLVLTPTLLAADAVSDAASQGQSFGGDLESGFDMPSSPGNSIQYKGSDGETQTWSKDDTTPFTSGSLEESRQAPSGINHDTSMYESAGGNEAQMEQGGNNAKRALFQDANKDEPDSIQGEAFKTVIEGTDRSRPSFENDPIFGSSSVTTQSLNNLEEFEENFTDCSAVNEFTKTQSTGEISNKKSCSRIRDLSGECKLTHEYELRPILEHVGGEFGVEDCGEGCVDLVIGKLGDNYWSGNCGLRTNSTSVKVLEGHAIESAVFKQAVWDDHIRTFVDVGSSSNLIFQGPDSSRWPTSSDIACELDTSWDENPNVDVTNLFRNASPGETVTFRNRVLVSGNGEGYGRIRIEFDKSAVFEEEWIGEEECMRQIDGIADQFASGNVTCSSMPPGMENGCVTTQFGDICPSDFEEPPTDIATQVLPGTDDINPLCLETTIESNFDFYGGAIECFEDHSTGETVCPTNERDGSLDTCKELEDDPGCGFISQECVVGAQGDVSGECYVFDEVWDCPEQVDIDDLEKEQTIECAGEIRCVGDECANNETQQSQSFQEAAALLNSAQFIQEDLSCKDNAGNNTECKAFRGEGFKCKVAVGGLQDCCDMPAATGLDTYLQGMAALKSLDSRLVSMGAKNGAPVPAGFKGGAEAYVQARNAVIDPVQSGWTEVSGQLQGYATSTADALPSAVSDSFTTVADSASQASTAVSETAAAMKQKVQQVAQDIFGSLSESLSGLVGAGGGGAGAGATGGGAGAGAGATGGSGGLGLASEQGSQTMAQSVLGNTGAAYLSAFMTAYTAVMVAYMVIQIVFACEEEEMELGGKRELKVCSKVGSYCAQSILGVCNVKKNSFCCFNSPLSRIIQEQVLDQLGRTFGSAKNPVCTGIPLSDLSSVDWSQIDLSEWIAMQESAGILPDLDDMGLEKMTGNQSTSDLSDIDGFEEERRNSQERSRRLFEGTDPDETRRNTRNKMDVFKGEPGKSANDFEGF